MKDFPGFINFLFCWGLPQMVVVVVLRDMSINVLKFLLV